MLTFLEYLTTLVHEELGDTDRSKEIYEQVFILFIDNHNLHHQFLEFRSHLESVGYYIESKEQFRQQLENTVMNLQQEINQLQLLVSNGSTTNYVTQHQSNNEGNNSFDEHSNLEKRQIHSTQDIGMIGNGNLSNNYNSNNRNQNYKNNDSDGSTTEEDNAEIMKPHVHFTRKRQKLPGE
jgi:predicted RND superfamily exporter protein